MATPGQRRRRRLARQRRRSANVRNNVVTPSRQRPNAPRRLRRPRLPGRISGNTNLASYPLLPDCSLDESGVCVVYRDPQFSTGIDWVPRTLSTTFSITAGAGTNDPGKFVMYFNLTTPSAFTDTVTTTTYLTTAGAFTFGTPGTAMGGYTDFAADVGSYKFDSAKISVMSALSGFNTNGIIGLLYIPGSLDITTATGFPTGGAPGTINDASYMIHKKIMMASQCSAFALAASNPSALSDHIYAPPVGDVCSYGTFIVYGDGCTTVGAVEETFHINLVVTYLTKPKTNSGNVVSALGSAYSLPGRVKRVQHLAEAVIESTGLAQRVKRVAYQQGANLAGRAVGYALNRLTNANMNPGLLTG